MMEREFVNGVAWVLLQVLGKDKTEAELQDAYDEAIAAMFRCEAGDEEAVATVVEAGHNFQATVKLHSDTMKRRQH